MDLIVIALYMAAMIGIGWYAKRRAKTESDYLVAGRRLGPMLYAGTMAALVMGGGATLGGIALGYQHGLAGAWLVFSMASGVALISLVLAPIINRLRVYTVSQMLELRYGGNHALISGIVMLAYTLMIAVTSTIAYGAIFSVLFDIGKAQAILIGSSVVILYSVLGGMWSITLTDFVQFVLKTVSIFFILLPISLWRAGGFAGLAAHLPAEAFSFTTIGGAGIFTYIVLYVPTMVIGQDLWQRVFTARNDRVARWAGLAAAAYCFLYGLAGALIGMATKVLLPNISARDQVYTQVVRHVLPEGLSGLVVAGALAAIMSTSSGALIATATVAKEDVLPALRRLTHAETASGSSSSEPSTRADTQADEVRSSRKLVVIFGVVMAGIACALKDVIAALTIASDILVGGLLVAVIGGMVWKRATAFGALVSIICGTIVTLGTMFVMSDLFANLPIYLGLAASLLAFVVCSLSGAPTSSAVLREWKMRVTGNSA
ncbi:MAG TPA: sodium:solute symporter [Steroidobacteraceae bacterium]|nr:sodium:solute symporter [Steroidobacteraceae bacterium]